MPHTILERGDSVRLSDPSDPEYGLQGLVISVDDEKCTCRIDWDDERTTNANNPPSVASGIVKAN